MSMFDAIIGQVSSSLGGLTGPQAGLAGTVLNLIRTQPGGVAGLVQMFHDKGLGGAVSSWVGTGPNQAISPDQVQHVLGNAQIQQIATEHGLDPQQVSGHLAQLLPALIDKLTPNGTLPAGDAAGSITGGITGTLRNLMGGPQG